MTPAELLESFETFADAPGGIQRLRELTLDLAVRGQLVPQNPKDTPASSLLASPGPAEGPHAIPSSWTWARLEQIADYKGRPTTDSSDIKKDAWVLDLEDIEKDSSRILARETFSQRASLSNKSAFKKGDVLYGKLRPYLNKVVVADSDGYCTTEIVPIVPRPGVIPEYLRLSLKSPRFLAHVSRLVYGVKMPRLGKKDAEQSLHPVPPTNEQRLIVAKVAELMLLIDRFEAARSEREVTRIALRDSTFFALGDAKGVDEVQTAWHRITAHADTLFIDAGDVFPLRQTLCQLAVRGRLTRQDSADKSAALLAKEIAAENETLAKNGRTRKTQPLPPISKTPFDLPPNWTWVRWRDASVGIQYGYTASASHKPTGVRLLRITDIQDGRVNWATVPGCIIDAQDTATYKIRRGDLLIARTGGTIGKSFLVEIPKGVQSVFASYLIRISPPSCTVPNYFFIFTNSPCYWEQLYREAKGTGQPNVNGTSLGEMLVPLPPAAEQERIVNKANDLLSMCTMLEERLAKTRAAQAAFAAAAAHHLTL